LQDHFDKDLQPDIEKGKTVEFLLRKLLS